MPFESVVFIVQGLELFKRVGEVAEAEGHHPDLHLVVSSGVWYPVLTPVP